MEITVSTGALITVFVTPEPFMDFHRYSEAPIIIRNTRTTTDDAEV